MGSDQNSMFVFHMYIYVVDLLAAAERARFVSC